MDAKKFLITGMLRTRSAWFTALLNAHGYYTEHEQIKPTNKDIGVCDPTAALIRPDVSIRNYSGHPIVFVNREASDSFNAWERFSGYSLPESFRDELIGNANKFITNSNCIVVQYSDLNKVSTVDSVVYHVTRRHLDLDLWRVFDGLKIEQHKDKAMIRFTTKD